ncbi:DUF4399 domain-containing protein [Paracraurococcus lichenis]|uniref:DUF4399 domain-containing protein n=1 Tax=Paracraurococcus lichenis TaxID=3064888 RepID=A0ABT9DW56_9PROT|nr:DUF4399 domain-containing protein [Paracraurococcus sp. LOR1-02]MDO9708129.1 DUF4399 domain-containing protein [Paracraurococcus sp. LOR1-02]
MTITRRLLLLGSAAAPALPGGAALAQSAPDQGHAHDAPAAAPADAPRQRQPAPKDAYVYIGWPQDGQVIYGTRFKVWFGTRNFGVAPAGVTKVNTGHHHIIVDAPLPPMDRPIPNDRNHLHFGLGQTETMLELPPGTHTLQLLMGDADHVPHDPPVMSKRITITVRAGRPQTVAATQAQ